MTLRRDNRLFGVLLGLCATLALVFLAIPILSLVTAIAPSRLLSLLTRPAALDALVVTIQTNLVANALILIIGTPAAYLLARRSFRGRNIVLTAIEVPLVLPPAVAGIALLAAFGTTGMLGKTLAEHGLVLPFTELAVVLAVTFVAAPFYLRAAISAFSLVDRDTLDAARDLGASEGALFVRIALPLAAEGLRTGWALAFARGIGEFGATLLFAGSVMKVTQTLPLAVYAELAVDLDAAIAVGLLLLLISTAVLLVSKLPTTWTPSITRADW